MNTRAWTKYAASWICHTCCFGGPTGHFVSLSRVSWHQVEMLTGRLRWLRGWLRLVSCLGWGYSLQGPRVWVWPCNSQILFFVEATILNCIYYIFTYIYINIHTIIYHTHTCIISMYVYIYRRAGACSAYPSNSWNIPSIPSILALEWGNNNIYPLVI